MLPLRRAGGVAAERIEWRRGAAVMATVSRSSSWRGREAVCISANLGSSISASVSAHLGSVLRLEGLLGQQDRRVGRERRRRDRRRLRQDTATGRVSGQSGRRES